MHFFEVSDLLIWKRVELRGNNNMFSSLLISHYNSKIHMGVILQNFE